MGEQMPLIPLTVEQLEERKLYLPRLLEQFEAMEKRHKETRDDMTDEKRKLQRAIFRCAKSIRVQGEPSE